jgi:hypothetical protein
MKVTGQGVWFSDYRQARPGPSVSAFTDALGATLNIDTVALIQMYELVKYDLKHRDQWDDVLGLAAGGQPVGMDNAELHEIAQRLSVIATKHCPTDHHDWQTLLNLVGRL